MKQQERDEKEMYYCRRERSFDSLDRSFQVPDDVEEDKIAARHYR
jgi:HSP20 family molecular chaperone IbpA